MSNRAHLYLPVSDENGDLRRYVRVRIYEADGKTLYRGKIYRDRLSAKVWSNPFVAAPALIDLYLSAPRRIVLGLQPDTSKPERLTEVIDVLFDADQSVTTDDPQRVEGAESVGALLCGSDSNSSFWKPLRVDHEHEMIAAGTVLAGPISYALRQAGGHPGTTVLGAGSGGAGAASSLVNATMLGRSSNGYGRGTVALGRQATATEQENSPWRDGAVAIGAQADADDEGVAIGHDARATSSVTIGSDASGIALSVSVGHEARAAGGGIALGRNTGASSAGPIDSIGLGAGAQYGLPSDPTSWAVMVGARDPSRITSFPWANPQGSQSESPWDEFGAQMGFTGRTVQLQRHLTWVIDTLKLQVDGDATLGGRNGRLGFYGVTPQAKQTVADDEPTSGISALDNLIYALRDLGLLRYRREASITYRALDMASRYRHGDLVPAWTEHFGTDVATKSPVARALPKFHDPDTGYNGLPTVEFDNGVDRKFTKPIQELRGSALSEQIKHFIVVGEHEYTEFGHHEGMFNLTGPESVIGQNTVLMSDARGSKTWQTVNVSKYALDALDQTGNGSAGLDLVHAYRMTARTLWPHGRSIIGGPRDQEEAGNAPRNWDNFTGSIAEIVGMDDTWDESHVQSMERGLMFLYGIRQSATSLRLPAENFLLTQHDPANGTFVFWTPRPYDDSFIGKVYGRATRVPKPVVYIPFISIYFSFALNLSFRGSLAGNWGNISVSSQYEVDVSVIAGDFDNDGDIDVDIDTEFNSSTEVRVGTFSLNNNFTWTMGQLSSRYGIKVCRIRHRTTKVVLCVSGSPPFRYADTEVRVYSTKNDGTLLLEGTSPLWGDGTFSARVRNPGRKVARIYEVSTGNLLGTTEYHETALPRTTVYASDDPDVSVPARDRAHSVEAALTAMAFCELDNDRRYRARHIAQTLAKIQNVDGSLNQTYSSALPARQAGTVQASATIWSIMAWLRYQADSGDGQFLPQARKAGDWLLTQLDQGSVRSVPAGDPSTADNALAYFALRDLGTVTGTASYRNAAAGVRDALLARHWSSEAGRFRESIASDREVLLATVYGGLFLLAIGDRERARLSMRHLKRFRVKARQVSASHYTGPTGLIGYKPYADLGTSPYINPPNLIDQAGTWAALLFKARYGEPIGDDVTSLLRWNGNTTVGDPTHLLYGSQFLSHSASAASAPYGLRARPYLGSAAWGYLLSHGARFLLTPDPLPAPIVTGLAMTATRDFSTDRITFRYSWTAVGASSAYEAIPEQSVDAGQTWVPVGVASVSGPMETIRDASAGPDVYATAWSTPVPSNPGTIYRVRVRLRNAAFGPWVASAVYSMTGTYGLSGYGTSSYGTSSYGA